MIAGIPKRSLLLAVLVLAGAVTTSCGDDTAGAPGVDSGPADGDTTEQDGADTVDADPDSEALQLALTTVARCQEAFALPAKFDVPPQVAQCELSQTGDMEMTVDGQDLLVVYNDPTVSRPRHPAQGIVLRILDGLSGLDHDPEVVETLADNYYGCYGINGPEWVVPDAATGMELGVVYRGADCVVDDCTEDGVHAVFREAGAPSTEFSWDVGPTGFRQFGTAAPQPLPSTYPGAYPDYGYSEGHSTYVSFGDPAPGAPEPDCLGACFGRLDAAPAGSSPPMVSIRDAIAPWTFRASGGHPTDGDTVYVSASRNGDSALLEVTLDGAGGAAAPVPLIDTPSVAESTSLVAHVFPGTTDTFIFASNQTPPDPTDLTLVPDDTISVVYPDPAGALQLEEVTTSAAGNPLGELNHFRVSQGELLGFPVLVLHFLAREVSGRAVRGSHALVVYRSGGTYHFVDPLFLGPDVFGTELVWLPDGQPDPAGPAGAWAFFRLRENTSGETRFQVERCWWGPPQ